MAKASPIKVQIEARVRDSMTNVKGSDGPSALRSVRIFENLLDEDVQVAAASSIVESLGHTDPRAVEFDIEYVTSYTVRVSAGRGVMEIEGCATIDEFVEKVTKDMQASFEVEVAPEALAYNYEYELFEQAEPDALATTDPLFEAS